MSLIKSIINDFLKLEDKTDFNNFSPSKAKNGPEEEFILPEKEKGTKNSNLDNLLLHDSNNGKKMTSMDSMAVRLAAIQSISGQLLPSKMNKNRESLEDDDSFILIIYQ